MTNNVIISPIGAYGNHIRWLLLMSPNINFFPQLNLDIEASDKNKLEFIRNNVYSDTRSCFNWLRVELEFSSHLQKIFRLSHWHHEVLNLLDKKLLVGDIDPDLSWRSYLKFNPLTNRESKKHFLNRTWVEIKLKSKNFQHPNKLHLDVDILYQSQLDYDFYKNITRFFNVTENYETANEIHGLWFNLHQQGEKAAVDAVLNGKFDQWKISDLNPNYIDPVSNDDKSIVRKRILEAYCAN